MCFYCLHLLRTKCVGYARYHTDYCVLADLKFPVASIYDLLEPTVWNSLSDDLRDPGVDSEHFQRDLKTRFYSLDITERYRINGVYCIARYKFTVTYLLTYLTL